MLHEIKSQHIIFCNDSRITKINAFFGIIFSLLELFIYSNSTLFQVSFGALLNVIVFSQYFFALCSSRRTIVIPKA